MVFKDFNLDGARQTGETAGKDGVTVTAIDVNGVPYSTTTDSFGLYALNVLTTSYPVRVEFSGIPVDPYFASTTLHGANNGTSVQFVSAPSCGIDIGVNNPTEFCQSNPTISVPIFRGGKSTDATIGALSSLVGFPYASGAGPTQNQILATYSKTGALWGVAYDRINEDIYASAVLKRHVDFGPLGIGGIYQIDVSNLGSPVTANWLDVAGDLGLNIGQNEMNLTATGRGLGTAANQAIASTARRSP